jgi:hypothetical protein
MNIKVLISSGLFLLLLIALSLAASTDTVTISLNATKVWWNDTINATGVATYANGTGIGGSVSLNVDGISYSCSRTYSNGKWNCTFNAPLEIGSYSVTVTITNDTSSTTQNTTTFSVAPYYGKTPIGTSDRVVYELPMLIQDMNGEIKTIFARIIVWKG